MPAALPLELHTSEKPEIALGYAAVEAARLVRKTRNQLLAKHETVTVDMLAAGRGSSRNTARQWIHRQRSSGRLFTVDDDGRVLIPTMQLDEAFDLDDQVADVTRELSRLGMSGWAIWRWYLVENGWIGERPIEAVRRGDDGAIAAALGGFAVR